jgi:hypothetical protein
MERRLTPQASPVRMARRTRREGSAGLHSHAGKEEGLRESVVKRWMRPCSRAVLSRGWRWPGSGCPGRRTAGAAADRPGLPLRPVKRAGGGDVDGRSTVAGECLTGGGAAVRRACASWRLGLPGRTSAPRRSVAGRRGRGRRGASGHPDACPRLGLGSRLMPRAPLRGGLAIGREVQSLRVLAGRGKMEMERA